MLNKEQLDYINSLKVSHPDIKESRLKNLLADSSWSESDIEEALSLYKGDYQEVTVPPPPDSVNDNPPDEVAEESQETQSDSSDFAVANNNIDARNQEVKANQPNTPRSKSKLRSALLIIFAIAVVAVAIFISYKQFLSLSQTTLTNDTILKTTLTKLSEVNSATYAVELSANVVEREEGVFSYKELLHRDPEYANKKARDQDRVRDMDNIINTINEFRRQNDQKRYPTSLAEVSLKSTDPLGLPYSYIQTDKGEGFTLGVTFETDEAIIALSKTSSISSRNINANNVTVTKLDYIYPKDFSKFLENPGPMRGLEQLITNDFAFNLRGSGTFDSASQTTDGRFGVEANFSVSGSSYDFKAEALKKSDDFYFIVYKIPVIPFILGDVSSLKNKWIHVTKKELRNNNYYLNFSEKTENKAVLEEYKEQTMLTIDKADQAGILQIIEKETVTQGEKELTRYGLKARTNKLIPFIKDMLGVYATYEHPLVESSSRLEKYLNAKQTKNILQYLEGNLTYDLYFDEEGYPVKFDVTLRYIPNDEQLDFDGKQLNLTTTFSLDEINIPLDVVPPAEFMSLDKAMEVITGKTIEESMLDEQLSNEQKPSEEKPSYTNEFADGLYEVRSFTGGNPLCSYDEVVEVSTNKLIYSSEMCEANITDIQPDIKNVTITISSITGEEKIVVPR